MARLNWSTLSFANRQTDLPGEPLHGTSGTEPRITPGFERQSDPLKAAQREDLNRQSIQPGPDQSADIAMLARNRRIEDQGRGSQMVANDYPHPVLRPSPELANEVDEAIFNARWRDEQRRALRAELLQGRDDLLADKQRWQGVTETLRDTDDIARAGDPERASREAFRAFRRAEAQHHPIMDQTNDIVGRAEAFLDQHPTTRNPSRGERR